MDHDGQSQFARELHLFSKALALDLPRRMIIVIIEADLAVGDDPFTSGQRPEFVIPSGLDSLDLMRVHADSCCNKWMLLSEYHRRPARFQIASDCHKMLNSRCAGARHHRLPVAIKPSIVNVAVVVDEPGAWCSVLNARA